jgi:LPS-assembly protein
MEASTPAWTVQGENVDLMVGDRMIANKTTLNAKGVPFFYSPYFYVPMGDRATGFLIPGIGSSSFKGNMVSQGFYWAIDDNKDATIGVDYMSKLGIGKHLEYRYLDFDGRGSWYVYHLYDKGNKHNYVALKGSSDIAITPDLKAYADINYVNHRDFYQRLGTSTNATIQRFLQSTAEVSLMSGDNNRLYLSSQYWIDMNSALPRSEPQKLPELGYAMHPMPVGPFVFDMRTSVTNFVRQVNEGGQRFDLMPTLSHTFGDEVRFGQSLSLRETLYGLHDAPGYSSFQHREAFVYRAYAQSRFLKQYDSFVHILEPSLAYVAQPGTKQLPLFDSTELFQRTSEIQLAIMNRFVFKAATLALRVVQPYETSPIAGTNALRPTRIEGNFTSPTWSLTFDGAQDFAQGRTDTLNSQISFPILERTRLSLGERYSRLDNLMLYTVAFETNYFKQWFFGGSLWYNGKNGGVRDLSVSLTYADPCWAVSSTVTRRPPTIDLPSDLNFMLLLELKGIGIFKFL